MVARILILATLLLVTGCKNEKQSGNLTAFLAAEIKACGGKELAGDRLPDLSGTWICKKDDEGTGILSDNVSFQKVDALLRELYGAPVRSGTTPENEQQWTIPATVAGCSIWYSKHGDGVQITVLKPFKGL
jgi:hypothetical protein